MSPLAVVLTCGLSYRKGNMKRFAKRRFAVIAVGIACCSCSHDTKTSHAAGAAGAATNGPNTGVTGADAGQATGMTASGGAGSGARTATAGAYAATGSSSSAGRPQPNRVTLPAADDVDGGIDTVAAHRTPPDPNIHFDWDETAPGAKQCDPGHYVGDFTCKLVFDNMDLGTATITGPVELTLAKSQNGEFLEITDAHIEGYALLILNFRAELMGRLDCSTRALDANAINGAVGLGDADLLPVLGFEGQLHGMLDDTGQMLTGDWSFPVTTQDGRLGVCTGPWTATRMEP